MTSSIAQPPRMSSTALMQLTARVVGDAAPGKHTYAGDLVNLKATITFAAAEMGHRKIDTNTSETIDVLINLATRDDSWGTDAQQVLRDLYADPACARIRDNLQRAALNMCHLAHVKGGLAPVSVTVAYLGGTAAQAPADLRNFLRNYLNIRMKNQPTVDLLDPQRYVKMAELSASGETLTNLIVKDAPIKLDSHDEATNGAKLLDMRKEALTSGKPVVALVNSRSNEFPHWIQVVVARKDDGGVEWHIINSAGHTKNGDAMEAQLDGLLSFALDEDRDTITHQRADLLAATPNSSAVLGDRFLRRLNDLAGESETCEGWIGDALKDEINAWAAMNPEDKQAAVLAGRAALLEAAAEANTRNPEDARAQAQQNHPPAASLRPAAVPAARPGAQATTATPGIPSRPSAAPPTAQAEAFSIMTKLGDKMGIKRDLGDGRFESPFSDAAARAAFDPSSRNHDFHSAISDLQTRLANFSGQNPANLRQGSATIFETLRTVASQDALNNLRVGPDTFLKHCKWLASHVKPNEAKLNQALQGRLQAEAKQFCAEQDKAANEIWAAINDLWNVTGDEATAAKELGHALKLAFHQCVVSDLRIGVYQFAKAVEHSPAAAIDYFHPGLGKSR